MLTSLYKVIIVKSFGQVKGEKKNFKEAGDTDQIVHRVIRQGFSILDLGMRVSRFWILDFGLNDMAQGKGERLKVQR